MRPTTVDQFISGLRAIPDEDFRVGTVYDYLKEHPVDEHSLRPYLFFSRKQYTRNLVFKNHLFELVAVCWEVGQSSNIHNHAGQNCWMTIPVGQLRVQNFSVVEQNFETGYCRVEPTESMDIDKLTPAEVDPTEPVHQVLNLEQFGGRAVSLHIYSRPIDRCLVYSPSQNHCREVVLQYTSEYGKLCGRSTYLSALR
jgi:predicted metal-dependent enzyme (double-stranded beta helix superfamily)